MPTENKLIFTLHFFAMGSLLDCCLSPRVFHFLLLFYFLYLIYIFVLLGRMCCGNKLEERQSEKGGGGANQITTEKTCFKPSMITNFVYIF